MHEVGQRVLAGGLGWHLQPFVDSGRLNKWAIPQLVRFVSEIPKTSVGKINKKLIRERHCSV
ncbi:hypothetical protein [Pseudomonas sp. SBB6]|uniref:hypothetical protein n=1 Tax=Pseudomonas sp. SBB6 TaxID=2962032 RepID=UPI0020B6B1B9|nr:hypothetical protein [Pseudomonas sp. SBB6]MCP3752637.1 hypothetical protein [Pseudomonas sp. SBB6]